jgi:thiol-disulfide isomerase/thioredoxin
MNVVRSRRVFVLAAALGIAVAGGTALYRAGWGGGKEAEARCAGAVETAGRLKPFAKGDLAALLPAEAPADVRHLAFTTPAGEARSLADYAGKAVLLNLWATWCAPCREEMPALDALQAARGGDRFQVVTVNLDVGDPEKPATFLEETGIKALPDYRDPKMAIFNDLKRRGLAFGMPTTLLVDGQGCQVAALHGPAHWDGAEALAAVDALSGS